MKIIKILFLFITTFVYSQQKIEYYNYGYDGMESISRVRGSDSMVVYSNYKSRPLIRREVCDTILNNYKKLKNGPYIVNIKCAKVFGRLEIDRKHNLVSIKYYYEKVNYGDTLIETIKNQLLNLQKKQKREFRRSNIYFYDEHLFNLCRYRW
jgi:hypothetical protein